MCSSYVLAQCALHEVVMTFVYSMTFFFATGLTALVFVTERKQGLLDRSFVAGNRRAVRAAFV